MSPSRSSSSRRHSRPASSGWWWHGAGAGDETAGSILILLTERGSDPQILERLLQPDGRYAWGRSTGDSAAVPELVARRRRFDPDLWVLELDVPSGERFAAEMIAFD